MAILESIVKTVSFIPLSQLKRKLKVKLIYSYFNLKTIHVGMIHVKDVYHWERIAKNLNAHVYLNHLIQLVNQVS
jgi:hypothetical protein